VFSQARKHLEKPNPLHCFKAKCGGQPEQKLGNFGTPRYATRFGRFVRELAPLAANDVGRFRIAAIER
jgi:hypothetical protein